MRRLAAVVAIALSACSLAPAYERPAAPISSRWAVEDAGGRAVDQLGWRQVFSDPRLQALIELALRNSRDLRISALDVERVRAQYRITRSALFPTIGLGASAEVGGTKDDATWQYTVGANLSYELDLFGRLRNLRAAALEEYLASAEAQRATHIALVAEVASQYLVVRAAEEEVLLATQTLALTRETADLTRRLLEGGQRSELDLRTAEAQVASAQAELARSTRLRAQGENALVLLVGVPALPASLPPPAPFDTGQVVAELSAGVPSEVLLRRPDVLAAEHALRAANANIGVARAAFFPSISLTAFGGLASATLGNLFSAGGFAWSVGAQLAQPLFTGGRNRAQLDVAKIRTQIEVARYELAIQTAFREVADTLAARATFDDQLAALTARVEAEQKRFAISQQRYAAGIENYLTLITAQRDLFVAQLALINTRLARLANLVTLYRALGGGWRA